MSKELRTTTNGFVNPLKSFVRGAKSKGMSRVKQAEAEEEELVIGFPQGMTHRNHMTPNPRSTWGIEGLPEEWKKILQKSNITRERILQNQDKAIIALKYVAEGGTVNNKIPLLTEQEMKQRMATTAQIVHTNPESRYWKLSKIGEGAGGVVYKIKSKTNNQIFAVKVSPIEELSYIKNEIAYHALSCHKNIVYYHETFQWKSDVWIVMDFVDGGCLTDILGDDNPEEWTERFISYVMLNCLQALAFMHAQHLLHRDIKSDNVLIGRDGCVKLADFGFAVDLNQKQKRRKSTVGTPFWMAPEVIEGVEYDERCDIWSLGITAIELVNHEPPHMDKQPVEALLDILTSPPPKPNNLDICSEQFLNFLDRSLEKDFNKRAFATELLDHPFMSRASTTEQFAGWVTFVLDEKAKLHRDNDSDDDDI